MDTKRLTKAGKAWLARYEAGASERRKNRTRVLLEGAWSKEQKVKEPRRVIVTLEVDTATSLTVLKNRWLWQKGWNACREKYQGPRDIAVQQVSVNVAQKAKQPKAKS